MRSTPLVKLLLSGAAVWIAIDFPQTSTALALTPEELTQSLYIKLAASVMPNGNTIKVGHSYFIVANPGIIIGSSDDLAGDAAQEALISAIDMAPQKDAFYEPGLFHLANLYKQTIDSMEVPHPPNESALLAEYQKLQGQKKGALKDAYKEYNDLRDAINTSSAQIEDYTRAQAEKLSKDPASIEVPTTMKLERVKAQKGMKDFSHLPEISILEDKLSTIENSLPTVFKERLRQQYVDRQTGAEFPRYVFFPSPKNWAKTSWTKYSTNETELTKFSKDEFKSSSGGLGGNTSIFGGFLGGNVSAGKNETWKYSDIESKGLQLDYELTRVGVYRPWLDAVFFTSRRWRIPAAGDLGCHVWSNGSPQAVDGHELSPFIVKSIVLSRNLKISGKWTKDLAKEYHLQEQQGGHVRFGFFSVGADSHHSVDQKESKANVSESTIENKDVQIIGFVVEPLGLLPNPDPNQAWTGTAPDCSK